jgi:hypothetical protein
VPPLATTVVIIAFLLLARAYVRARVKLRLPRDPGGPELAKVTAYRELFARLRLLAALLKCARELQREERVAAARLTHPPELRRTQAEARRVFVATCRRG